MKDKRSEFRFIAISILTISFVILLWFLISRLHLVPSIFVPSPIDVWNTFLDIAFQDGYKGIRLWGHLLVSLIRISVAFIIAAITGITLGLLSGYSKHFRAIVIPIIYFYRPLPPLAYYTILIIWLGIGDVSKITLLTMAGFAPIFIACVSAFENLDPTQITVSKSLGASNKQTFIFVILPSCLPEIFTGLRTAIGFIYTTLVAAEMVAATSGIGWMVLDASKYLQSEIIFVGIIVMGITGILIDIAFGFIEKKMIPWKGMGE